ncbi:hypothetical protein [Lysobacter sp. Root690]|uniref:hypothetical protein n=1 Tax=Lysobacter sp. Root690 TaxID=1736588 RepID=UPI0012FC4E9C|nr:hypothetical protein [Lysobacter sp. Root690]
MKAAIWVQDSVRALPRYLLVLAAVSALALLARAAAPSASHPSVFPLSDSHLADSHLPDSHVLASPVFASPVFASGVSAVPASVSGAVVPAPHAAFTSAGSATAHGLAARTPTASRTAAHPHEHDALIAALSQRASSIPGNSGALRRDEVSPSAAARFNIGTGDPRAGAITR